MTVPGAVLYRAENSPIAGIPLREEARFNSLDGNEYDICHVSRMTISTGIRARRD
jgi:hypothetical protein